MVCLSKTFTINAGINAFSTIQLNVGNHLELIWGQGEFWNLIGGCVCARFTHRVWIVSFDVCFRFTRCV